jgi:hypothetical protein
MKMAKELLQQWNCAASDSLHRKMLPRSQEVIAALSSAISEAEAGDKPEPDAYLARTYDEFMDEWEWDAYTPWMYEERKSNPKYHDWTPVYRTPPTHTAAVQAALERAAQQCEDERVEVATDADSAYNLATEHCAASIRAIKPEDVLEGK